MDINDIDQYNSFGNNLEVVKKSYIDNIIKEIKETELTYLKDLNDVIEGYKKQLANQGTLSKININQLFSNITFIYRLNGRLNKYLILCDDSISVSKCFLKFSEKFKTVYSYYTLNYSKAIETLEKLMKNPKLSDIFANLKKKLGHALPLNTYLFKPIQRILKYHLLFKSMFSHANNAAEELAISRCLDAMLSVAQHINEIQRQVDLIKKVNDNLKKVQGLKGFNLNLYGSIINEGHFLGSNKENYFVYLFEKAILVVKQKKDGQDYLKAIFESSSLMFMSDISKNPLSFCLISVGQPKMKLLLQASTVDIKDLWCCQIQKCILKTDFNKQIDDLLNKNETKSGYQSQARRRSTSNQGRYMKEATKAQFLPKQRPENHLVEDHQRRSQSLENLDKKNYVISSSSKNRSLVWHNSDGEDDQGFENEDVYKQNESNSKKVTIYPKIVKERISRRTGKPPHSEKYNILSETDVWKKSVSSKTRKEAGKFNDSTLKNIQIDKENLMINLKQKKSRKSIDLPKIDINFDHHSNDTYKASDAIDSLNLNLDLEVEAKQPLRTSYKEMTEILSNCDQLLDSSHTELDIVKDFSDEEISTKKTINLSRSFSFRRAVRKSSDGGPENSSLFSNIDTKNMDTDDTNLNNVFNSNTPNVNLHGNAENNFISVNVDDSRILNTMYSNSDTDKSLFNTSDNSFKIMDYNYNSSYENLLDASFDSLGSLNNDDDFEQLSFLTDIENLPEDPLKTEISDMPYQMMEENILKRDLKIGKTDLIMPLSSVNKIDCKTQSKSRSTKKSNRKHEFTNSNKNDVMYKTKEEITDPINVITSNISNSLKYSNTKYSVIHNTTKSNSSNESSSNLNLNISSSSVSNLNVQANTISSPNFNSGVFHLEEDSPNIIMRSHRSFIQSHRHGLVCLDDESIEKLENNLYVFDYIKQSLSDGESTNRRHKLPISLSLEELPLIYNTDFKWVNNRRITRSETNLLKGDTNMHTNYIQSEKDNVNNEYKKAKFNNNNNYVIMPSNLSNISKINFIDFKDNCHSEKNNSTKESNNEYNKTINQENSILNKDNFNSLIICTTDINVNKFGTSQDLNVPHSEQNKTLDLIKENIFNTTILNESKIDFLNKNNIKANQEISSLSSRAPNSRLIVSDISGNRIKSLRDSYVYRVARAFSFNLRQEEKVATSGSNGYTQTRAFVSDRVKYFQNIN